MAPIEVVFLGINDVGEQVYEWLLDREDADVVALVTTESQLDLVQRLQPDLIVSAGFRYIVPEEVLDVPDLGAVNLHKSFLPYNRGANPNVWSIIEDAPAGVSIHYMTADIDAGPIVDRQQVTVQPDDTARDLYERLEREQIDQFEAVWPSIRDGTAETIKQAEEDGTYHYKQDFVDLWEIDHEETVEAGSFLDRLRALTFPPYRNAYFEVDGRRYYVEVSITPEDADDATGDDVAAKNVPEYDEGGDLP